MKEKEITWDDIRVFYQMKKQKWSKTKSYYSGNSEWGTNRIYVGDGNYELYGYEMRPPYSEEEVATFENESEINLPKDLRIYLTEVSRELFVSSYPSIFSLHSNGPWESEFKLPPDKNYWNFEDCLEHGQYPQYPDDDENYGSCGCPSATGGKTIIGEGGCDELTYIVLKGEQHGSVWHASGDWFSRKYNTFWDYVTEPIRTSAKTCGWYRSNGILTYNMLRMMSGLNGLSYTK